MWTIIIFAVIGFVIGFIIMYPRDYVEDYLISFLNGLLFGVLSGFIGALIALSLPAKTEVVKTTYNLASLKDDSRISGAFFLGSGRIEGKMVYTFYYKKDDYYKLSQIDVNLASIKYTNDNPRIERYTTEKVKGAFINNFALDIDEPISYVIYIPEGSIKQDYILDSE